MLISTLFKNLSKESRTQEEIYSFSTFVLDMGISYYNSRICVLEVGDRKKNIFYDCHNITI